MLIYVIRHGQTDWNAERRLQGQKDIPMNATGLEQARRNGLALLDILGEKIDEFDFVASPLKRTRATMEIIRTAMGLPPLAYRTDPRLVEISFGDWEGSTLKELKATQRERVAERNASKWDFIPPGDDAESYEILSWRTGSWLASVDRPTVCVTHGGVIRTLFQAISDLPKSSAAEGEIPQDRIVRIETAERTIVWL
ncbi:putative phosphoglycerate mutase [Rhizobium pisi]|uniref:Histidine phosphatase family protein n=2 Tax=Rhizobium TaxID=379 RepID=A0A7W6B416_9HYPH|nr:MULTISPECIES: histidine phosphatase family protein [Rhizobium]MBB3133797.1 putative phosphoglycerate mutase [Rhizobium pisi]MBB3915203.1 putative phosphoglycerate mutase [Rhizobium fabae]RSB81785.1 histidine phosphatase family protein [Rhizobium pisi]RUM12639.1 histidine phosphatase family protein [Rhizobium fabae]TCA51036.1 histidine phosphatase family protein [Rhizobium pisi]